MKFLMFSQLFNTASVHRKPSDESKSNVTYWLIIAAQSHYIALCPWPQSQQVSMNHNPLTDDQQQFAGQTSILPNKFAILVQFVYFVCKTIS